jgi:isoleucyl-tRNA synthetase
VVSRLQNYCSEDLGGFYLDILKDRLYTTGVDSPARRSAQTALWHIAHSAAARDGAGPVLHRRGSLGRVRGPASLRRQRRDHLHAERCGPSRRCRTREALLAKYALLREVRADVTKQLEEVRASGAIGSSLQAELAIKAAGAKYAALASLDDDLKFVFITSQASVEQVGQCGQ